MNWHRSSSCHGVGVSTSTPSNNPSVNNIMAWRSVHREQHRVPESPLLCTVPWGQLILQCRLVQAESWWNPRQAFGKVWKSTAWIAGKKPPLQCESKPSLISLFQNLTLEGAHIVAGDIASTNGIIHIIDKVYSSIGVICSSTPQAVENTLQLLEKSICTEQHLILHLILAGAPTARAHALMWAICSLFRFWPRSAAPSCQGCWPAWSKCPITPFSGATLL